MAAIVYLALGAASDLTPDGRWVATIGTLMAIWWMTEAIRSRPPPSCPSC